MYLQQRESNYEDDPLLNNKRVSNPKSNLLVDNYLMIEATFPSHDRLIEALGCICMNDGEFNDIVTPNRMELFVYQVCRIEGGAPLEPIRCKAKG